MADDHHDLITRPLPDEMGSKASPTENVHGAACEVCGQHGTKDTFYLDRIAALIQPGTQASWLDMVIQVRGQVRASGRHA